MSEATTQQSASIAKLLPALIKARKSFPKLAKDSVNENKYFTSKYSSLAAVLEACDDVLGANDLAILQTPVWEGGALSLLTSLCHTSGEWIRSTYPITTDILNPQKVGGGLTYARRYTYMSIAGIAPEDDDGEAASGRGGAQAATQPRTNPVAERNRQSHEGRTNGIGRAPAQAPAGWGGGLAAAQAPAAPVNGNGHTNGHTTPAPAPLKERPEGTRVPVTGGGLYRWACDLERTNGQGLIQHMCERARGLGWANYSKIISWDAGQVADAFADAEECLEMIFGATDEDAYPDDDGYTN